jgi:hypothetical protein
MIEEARSSIAMRLKPLGRIPFDNAPIMRAFLAKHYFRIATVEALRNHLLNNPNLRTICVFLDGVPSAPTFSRRMSEFGSHPIMTETLNNLIDEHLKDWLIPNQIFVRGFGKVSFLLMSAVVCLAALKILQYFVLPAAEAT